MLHYLIKFLNKLKPLIYKKPSTSCIDKTCVQIQHATSESETEDASEDSESEENNLFTLTKTFEEDKARPQ